MIFFTLLLVGLLIIGVWGVLRLPSGAASLSYFLLNVWLGYVPFDEGLRSNNASYDRLHIVTRFTDIDVLQTVLTE